MRGQVIGKSMPHGYAGSYARQADMVVDTHPVEKQLLLVLRLYLELLAQ